MGWAAMTVFIGAGTGCWAHLLCVSSAPPNMRADPLAALRIPTYAMTLRGGSLFRVSVTMAPFLLPTMFQLGFGLNPFVSGLLIIPLIREAVSA